MHPRIRAELPTENPEAPNIGKVAKVGGAVLPVALEVYAVISEDRKEGAATRERMRRRSALIARILSQCDEITRSTLVQVRAELDVEFAKGLRAIDELNSSVRNDQVFRGELEREIGVIQAEAESMLDRLAAPGLP